MTNVFRNNTTVQVEPAHFTSINFDIFIIKHIPLSLTFKNHQ